MAFTDEELGYLKSQPLARLATVGPDGQPDVVPVGFEYDGTYFYVGGVDPANTRKVRNVRAGHDQLELAPGRPPRHPRRGQLRPDPDCARRLTQVRAAFLRRRLVSWTKTQATAAPVTKPPRWPCQEMFGIRNEMTAVAAT
ncbi:PPOX class F420-dependent enzyme/OxyR family protein [Kribbella steppae]|uniref:PPOX class F420-dependent enzyme/OxyR family protein n=1 Tax=Kribbella steppae TaxID=2512223 RepID=A0A4R2HB33_9ACTN|nr:PPOX class F420-dependent enzyme/OxyR family protein [Kribbella steppae]